MVGRAFGGLDASFRNPSAPFVAPRRGGHGEPTGPRPLLEYPGRWTMPCVRRFPCTGGLYKTGKRSVLSLGSHLYMIPMKEFKIFVNNKTGELARVTEALATHAVNILALSSEGGSPNAFLRIVTGDVATTEKALKKSGLSFELNEIIDVELIDRPGELAKIARRLARQGVNVESIYILGTRDGKTRIAMTVSDLGKARA